MSGEGPKRACPGVRDPLERRPTSQPDRAGGGAGKQMAPSGSCLRLPPAPWWEMPVGPDVLDLRGTGPSEG